MATGPCCWSLTLSFLESAICGGLLFLESAKDLVSGNQGPLSVSHKGYLQTKALKVTFSKYFPAPLQMCKASPRGLLLNVLALMFCETGKRD